MAELFGYRIKKVTPSGTVTIFAGSGASGSADGTGTAAQFGRAVGVAIDSSDNVYVVDQVNQTIRKITSSGVVTTIAGSTQGYADGTGTAAQFKNPIGIAVDSSGNLYIGDSQNHRIRKIVSGNIVTTLAGDGTQSFADGSALSAKFADPYGVALDANGNIYVADTGNNRIRKITP